MNPIRLLIVDDRPDNSMMLRLMLDREPDLEVVGERMSADDLLETCLRQRVDVVLLDLRMPGRPPLDALEDLTRELPSCRTIVCSGADEPDTVDRVRAIGAWGFIPKSRPISELIRAVRSVARGVPSF